MLSNHYYEQLSFQEQNTYNLIKDALLNQEQTCIIENSEYDLEALKRIWSSVVLDNPDIVHYPALFCAPSMQGTTLTINFEYSIIDNNAFNVRLNKLVDKIESQLPLNASDYLVCKKIYDILAEMICYDFKVLDDYIRLENSNAPRDEMVNFMTERSTAFTPYGIVMNSKGVCQGISKLYKILCNRFRVQCACVEAKTNDENQYPHMLNVVEVSGKRAFVDLTAGLKNSINGLPLIRYDYFLVSSRIYGRAYVVSGDFECVDETVNYYTKNKVRFKSFDDMRNYLSAYTVSSTNGEVRCHYDGIKMSDADLQEAFSYILASHCEDNCILKGYYVKNGFCIGLINNETED